MKKSAKQKLLEYFKENVGVWIHYKKLADVASTSDWAREIRTLRQEGWKIQHQGGSKKSEYQLTSIEKGEGKKRGYISKKLRVKIFLAFLY